MASGKPYDSAQAIDAAINEAARKYTTENVLNDISWARKQIHFEREEES